MFRLLFAFDWRQLPKKFFQSLLSVLFKLFKKGFSYFFIGFRFSKSLLATRQFAFAIFFFGNAAFAFGAVHPFAVLFFHIILGRYKEVVRSVNCFRRSFMFGLACKCRRHGSRHQCND
ncbi:hypothetical protein HMPREF9123_2049 [Neisseria bacilliformis ATCC BAA-1200]|uniref:Uncharacterized protein n=1 Tax=Neisseria bacilliformis ATCC BAA-1200 TaxID=888742 RepID=F2BE93_9NEIS|nr:hypothetical protein HMPREF9123_2049 [Neisseria bacilliformis ATCC BAA-1200]